MINEKVKEVRAPIVIRGAGVGRGVAIGPLRFGPMRAESRLLKMEGELRLLERASMQVREELRVMEDRAVKSVGEEHGEIYRLLLGELDGGEFINCVQSLIESGGTLLSAIDQSARETAERAEETGGREAKAAKARAREIAALLQKAAEELDDDAEEGEIRSQGTRAEGSDDKKYILVASDTDGFLHGPDDASSVIGIVSVGGSEGSGLAAYARARGIPTLVVSSADAPSPRLEGSGAIIDPERGRLTVNPDLAALDKFTESARALEEKEERLASLIGLPSVTRSGRHIALLATVCESDGVPLAVSADAEGIGLLIVEADELDAEGEKDRSEYYKMSFNSFEGKPLTIGLYPKGRDKGLFGARYLLDRRGMLKSELRAVLRAAVLGEITLALSGIVSPEEMRRVRAVMVETALDLKKEGVAFGDKLRLAAIIDTPAAALCGDLIAPEVDAFIADTDILSELSLAAHITSPDSAEVIRRNPEPVLRMIEMTARAIHSSGKGKLMGVTGGMALDRTLTERLIGMGVDFLCVPPPYILEMREKIRECPD